MKHLLFLLLRRHRLKVVQHELSSVCHLHLLRSVDFVLLCREEPLDVLLCEGALEPLSVLFDAFKRLAERGGQRRGELELLALLVAQQGSKDYIPC